MNQQQRYKYLGAKQGPVDDESNEQTKAAGKLFRTIKRNFVAKNEKYLIKIVVPVMTWLRILNIEMNFKILG